MKKLALGCGLIVLICGLAAIGGAYYLYHQVRSTVAQFADLGQIDEIERGVRARGGFVPPASGELTAAQVERLVGIQSRVRERLGERFRALEAKHKALSEKERPGFADVPAILTAYGDIAAAWIDAKKSQVEALNDAGLSLEEYRWIREQAYRALGAAYLELDPGSLGEEIGRKGPREAGRIVADLHAAAAEANGKLVERFRAHLEEHLALASFGL